MGTRIEEAIIIISDIDKAYRTFTPEEIRALETTLNVMHKYQEIKNIVKNNNGFTDGTLEHSKAFTKIAEVVEDGNVD